MKRDKWSWPQFHTPPHDVLLLRTTLTARRMCDGDGTQPRWDRPTAAAVICAARAGMTRR